MKLLHENHEKKEKKEHQISKNIHSNWCLQSTEQKKRTAIRGGGDGLYLRYQPENLEYHCPSHGFSAEWHRSAANVQEKAKDKTRWPPVKLEIRPISITIYRTYRQWTVQW